MRTMVKFKFAAEVGNQVIRTGKIEKVLQGIMEYLKPEAAYFYPEDGQRAGLMVFDMQDASQVAEVVERFAFGLNASIELTPVMNGDDLQKGLSGVPGIIQQYG